MASFDKKSITIAAAVILIFLSLITNIMPYGQEPHHLRFSAEGGACIDYDQSENTIAIDCNASFLDVVQAINDPDIVENTGNGEYLLKASLQVDDDTTFSIGPNDITWLKITDTNGIIVHGKIQIDGVKITSWDTETDSPVLQTDTGSVPRAFINLRESEGGFVHNSEIAYLGYQEFGRRGFDLFGDGPSHDMEIRGSKVHDMWFAFYSRGAYNITVDGNEYYNNIKYALDPHSGTHDMSITNNYLHHNPIGAICSNRCSNILIEGNLVEHNRDHGIFFSRNMHDSIARNNYIYNTTTGIIVSESPNNEIYSNTIEGATRAGIRLSNPPNPEDGIREIRSHDNILEDNKFFNIESDDDDD